MTRRRRRPDGSPSNANSLSCPSITSEKGFPEDTWVKEFIHQNEAQDPDTGLAEDNQKFQQRRSVGDSPRISPGGHEESEDDGKNHAGNENGNSHNARSANVSNMTEGSHQSGLQTGRMFAKAEILSKPVLKRLSLTKVGGTHNCHNMLIGFFLALIEFFQDQISATGIPAGMQTLIGSLTGIDLTAEGDSFADQAKHFVFLLKNPKLLWKTYLDKLSKRPLKTKIITVAYCGIISELLSRGIVGLMKKWVAERGVNGIGGATSNSSSQNLVKFLIVNIADAIKRFVVSVVTGIVGGTQDVVKGIATELIAIFIQPILLLKQDVFTSKHTIPSLLLRLLSLPLTTLTNLVKSILIKSLSISFAIASSKNEIYRACLRQFFLGVCYRAPFMHYWTSFLNGMFQKQVDAVHAKYSDANLEGKYDEFYAEGGALGAVDGSISPSSRLGLRWTVDAEGGFVKLETDADSMISETQKRLREEQFQQIKEEKLKELKEQRAKNNARRKRKELFILTLKKVGIHECLYDPTFVVCYIFLLQVTNGASVGDAIGEEIMRGKTRENQMSLRTR